MSIGLQKQILTAISSVVGHTPAALHEPLFQGNEWAYLKECLDTTFVSSVGKFVDRFESELSEYTGAKYAIAVVNGTAALHVALLLGGVQQGHEVLLPALTFVATANAVRYCGAIPHFVDSEIKTLGIDPFALREYLKNTSVKHNGKCINKITGRVIQALVPMHTFGHPSDLAELLAVANDYGLILIEDAAESLGSIYQGRHTGTFGLMGTLSFNGNKTITTGGGGAILTNDKYLAQRAKHITTTAKLAHRWDFEHDEVGYNYRMPNINAALGCAQIEKISSILAAKRRLHLAYSNAFNGIGSVHLVVEPDNCQSNYWLQTILLQESIANLRDSILEETNAVGLMTRPAWRLLHRLKPYADCPRSTLSIAEMLERCIVNLPSSACLA